MANPVSELVISLVLDALGFKKGLSDAEKATKSIGETAKKTGDNIRKDLGYAFTDVVKAAFPLLGVAATINALASAQQSLYKAQRASKEVGIPSNEFAAWGRAAESLGFSAEDAQNSLVSLQASMQEAALTGRSAAAGVLTYMGIGLFKSNGELKTATEIFKDLSKVLANMPIDRARAYGQMMGLSPSTIALLREGKELSEELANQLKIGPTKEQAERAWETQKAWNQLKLAGSDLAREVFVDLEPAFVGLADVLRLISSFLGRHHEFVTFAGSAIALTLTIGKLVKTFIGLYGAIRASKTITALIPLFTATGNKIVSVLTAIGVAAKSNPLILIIGGIVAALYSLSSWFKGESSVIGHVLEAFGIKAEKVLAIIKMLGKILTLLLTPFSTFINLLGAVSEAFDPKNNDIIAENGLMNFVAERSGIVPIDQKNTTGKKQQSFDGYLSYDSVKGMMSNYPAQSAKAVQTSPSVVNKNSSARTVNSQVHNEVTINAPNGDAKTIQRAAQSGIQGGMSGYDRSLIAFQETGFISK